MKKYPKWICSDCGLKYGKVLDIISTFHMGKCGWCKKNGVPVTQPGDFGFPGHKDEERIEIDRKEREWMDIICQECKQPYSKTLRDIPKKRQCSDCYWKARE